MGLKTKNVNILRIHQSLRKGKGGGGSQKSNIYGELPKKWCLDNLQGAWQKIGKRMFLSGVDTSMRTMT